MTRFIRIFAAVCILFCVAGFTEQPALAEGAEPSATYVAQVGGTKYTTVQDAFDHAASYGTIILLTDVQLTSTVSFSTEKFIFLDMSGYDITGNCTIFNLSNKACLQLEDTTNTGSMILSDSPDQSAVIVAGSYSQIYLYDASIVSTNAVGVETVGGAVVIYSGSIEGGTYGVSCNNDYFGFSGGTVSGKTAYFTSDTGCTPTVFPPDGHLKIEISDDQKTATVMGPVALTLDGLTFLSDIQGAVDFAGCVSNAKFKLLDDIEINKTILTYSGGNWSLDLNGHQITGSGTLFINNSEYGFFIKNTSDQPAAISTTSNDVPMILNYRVLELKNVTLSGGSCGVSMKKPYSACNPVLILDGSVITCENGAGVNYEDGTVSLVSGTVSGSTYAFCDAVGALWTGYALSENSGYITNTDTTVTVGIKHTLAFTAGTGGSITTGSGGDYVKGAEINLSASPDDGYYFSGWTSSGGGTFENAGSVSTIFTMPESAATVTANFAEITYPLTIMACTGGSITTGSSANYSEGTKVSLAASPDAGYHFSGWTSSGGGIFENAGSASTAFTMPTGAVTVTANFAQISSGDSDVRYTVLASAGEGGSISPSGSVSVAYGGSKTYSITAGEGYEIEDVLVDGVSVGAVYTYTFENVKKAHIIKAVFEKTKSTVQWENPYADVTDKSWYYDAVRFVSEKGLMIGTSSNVFSPNGGMTRGMFVTVLYRLSRDIGNYTGSFTDVPSGEWYAPSVAWAAQNGIAGGVGDNKFAPDAGITREQLAVILYNYAKYKGYDVSVGEDTNILSYKGAQSISEYAYSALQWACGAGIINGDNGYLNSNGPATRAQVATMLQRFVENVVD